jgi:sugar-specific transcriptional regulator TrmB
MISQLHTLLQEFGLSPNESSIYETLVREGELGVAAISRHSGIHRRNVYDALQRLLEKGLVYEILEQKFSSYQAVSPEKLMELLDEKKSRLELFLPDLLKLYHKSPVKESVLIYRGAEGLKNYMRDIIRQGSDYYSIGAKGIWADPRLATLLPSFLKEAQKKKIEFRILYDPIVRHQGEKVLKLIPANYRFLPEHCRTPASLGIFGDTTVVLSDHSVGRMKDEICFTVITNSKLADSLRSWFSLLWSIATPEKLPSARTKVSTRKKR